MKYDLSKPFKAQSAQEYFDKLLSKQSLIELREVRVNRNLDQNGLYWVWLGCLQTETGMNKNELHYLFRANFLAKETDEILQTLNAAFYQQLKRIVSNWQFIPGINSVIDVISHSTTEIDTAQFAAYLNEIQSFSRVHFDVVLLSLDDKHFIEFYREYGFTR